MTARSYPRATEPHIPSVVDAVRPLLVVANAGGFYVSWANGVVTIEQGGWNNVDDGAMQAVIDAAPTHSEIIATIAAEQSAATTLKLPTFAEIDAIVDQVFFDHTAAQRTVLKRVFKLVRAHELRG